jgi:hypothetical protein
MEPRTQGDLAPRSGAAWAVPFNGSAVGHLQNIGSNTGCDSIHAALKYQFSTTGVDINPH